MLSSSSKSNHINIKPYSIRQQWQLVKEDKWLFSCLTWVPLLLCFSIYLIFSQGMAYNLPIGVVDLNKSLLSQELVRHYDATSILDVSHQYNDMNSAKKAMVAGDIYAILYIPPNFDKSTIKLLAPQVTLFYNSQFILVGRLIDTAALQAQGTFNAELEVIKNLSKGKTTTDAAIGKAVPIRMQITPLFNKSTNYAQFLVTAIVPAIWQIAIVSFTILVLGANHRVFGLNKWLGQGGLADILLILTKTLASYFFLFLLHGFLFIFAFYKLMAWPMQGSWSIIIIAQALTVIACMVIAALFFFLTCDAARAMSFAGAMTAPSFAFMGITFPTTDMNSLAIFWRKLLPISHYIEIQVSQASFGVPAIYALRDLMPMFAYAIPLVVSLVLIKKHRHKESLA